MFSYLFSYLDYDSKCVAFNHTNYKTRHTPNFGNDRDCRWLNYFVTWLRSISAARVKTVEFVQGGSYPDYGARKYVELSSGEVTYTAPFTKNDIVFIDYSMNEARYFTQKERLHDQQSRLEFLIRTIYDNTSQNSTGWPVIIQTETWPYPCGFCWKETHHMDYASVYTKVMSHYKLPIFSYKDFIWSDHLKTNHPDLQRALAYKESHPLWPHHIYFADIYAGLFSRELKRAYRFHESMMHANHSGDIHAYKKHNDIIQTQSKPPPPRPLSTFEIVDYCSKQTKPILDLDASDYIQNSDSSLQRSGRIVGSYAVVIPPYNHADVVKTNPDSSVGWNIIDDKKGNNCM